MRTVADQQRRQRGRQSNGQGAIDQMKDGRWRARYSDNGKRRVLYGRTAQEAADKLLDVLGDARDGTLVTSSRVAYARWLEQWLVDHVEPSVAITTFERYRGIVRNYVEPELGGVQLGNLTSAHLRRCYRRLRDIGLAPATLLLIHTVVHRSLRDARRDGLVSRNVAEDAAPAQPRDRDATERAFTASQLAVLSKAMVGHRHEQLWRVLLLTGMRVGEAAALTWGDVDLERARVIVRRSYRRTLSGPVVSAPKTHRGRRTIPLGLDAVAALTAQQSAVPAGTRDLVFPNSLGKPFRADKVLEEFKEVLRDAGLPERRLHDLRHTYATALYARDVNPRSVQELLGHARLEMTMDLYTGSVTEALRSAVRTLDDLLVSAPLANQTCDN